MRDEQINASIAEACGWKAHDHPECMAKKEGWRMPEMWIMRPDGELAFRHEIPNYCNDLNAMHEAEKMLGDPAIRREYVYLLGRIVNACGRFDAIHATARQRAEAFLRTIGRWEE